MSTSAYLRACVNWHTVHINATFPRNAVGYMIDWWPKLSQICSLSIVQLDKYPILAYISFVNWKLRTISLWFSSFLKDFGAKEKIHAKTIFYSLISRKSNSVFYYFLHFFCRRRHHERPLLISSFARTTESGTAATVESRIPSLSSTMVTTTSTF